MFNLTNHKRGFTLIETFVAITILVIAVIGPLSLMIRGITDGNYAKNEVAAFYIAQEGLELVMNQRDANQFGISGAIPIYEGQEYPWLSGLNECIDDDGCRVSVADNDIEVEPCTRTADDQICEPFVFSDVDAEPQTEFVRQIRIIPGRNRISGSINFGGDTIPVDQSMANQAEVIVTVIWKNKAAPRSLVLKDVIYERPLSGE